MTETHQNAPAARAVYRAEAFVRNGRWHLEVASLDSEPDTGDTEALLVTLWPVEEAPNGSDFPAASLVAQLRDSGFELADPGRGTGWTPTGDRDRYTASCYATDETT
ncbi:hypothetical protein SAMN05428954_0144 [Streptomyces sp. 2112.3]|uniref:hypothetical protein n=1 Tax=Streptomyces sp. 2112.3 TaxID=1881023 RepID=UPI000898B33D|nr:hypothetical protein [Streptomyces sp. 2112.3]SED35314.1 hypothetical protein SAMN05428954_0144 [Streptomyces sp. 2112.3]